MGLEWGVLSSLGMLVAWISLCSKDGLTGGMQRGVWRVCCCLSCVLFCVLDVPVCFSGRGEKVSDIVKGVWSDVEH